MAQLFPGALLFIVSLLNTFTVGASLSRIGDLHSSLVFSDDPNSVLLQQTEAELISASHTRTRSKRCTCYSFKDRECVYYCHLGIIWINTPQRTVPYGMSSYRSPQRLRRSSGTVGKVLHRCTCADHSDAQCYKFCNARRTVPYGMSSYRSPQRLRRSSGTVGKVLHRCTCADHSDAQCYKFCNARTPNVPDRRLIGRSPG